MVTNVLQSLLFLFFLFQVLGIAAATCSIPGTGTSCNELVSGLPYQFIVKEEKGTVVRFSYLSKKGVKGSSVHLKIFLTASNHDNRDAAARELSQIAQKTDPNMGLSYAWDKVLHQEETIYYLHADCSLSEQYFQVSSQTLERIIRSSDTNMLSSLLCRCGGGCK